jgi:PTH1 family peptidyl-tRNA hydrolase
VRLGVGRTTAQGGLVDHVLGQFAPAQRCVVRQMVATAADAVQCLVEKGLAEAMNRFNGWQADPAGPANGN